MARKLKNPPITIDGLDELRAGVKQVLGIMDDKEVANICLEGAKVIRTAMKRRAKGSIKRAIRAKKARRYPKHKPSAWAAVDRKKAPHAHLVESGHEMVVGRKYETTGGAGKRRARRMITAGRVVGRVPPHPFMVPAIQQTKSQVKAVLTKGFSRGLESVKRRRTVKKK